MFKKTLPFWLLFTTICLGQIPDYYLPVNFNATGINLRAQLAQLITESQHTVLSYTPGVWNAVKQTDLDPENTSQVLLIYGYDNTDENFVTDRTRGVNDNCTSSNCDGLWNREHVYPRSLGTPNLGFDFAGSDAHNLRACDAQMNADRGNKRFAAGNGNATVMGNLFYPGDEWKGDVARMMMYMYLRYGNQCLPNNVGSGSTGMSPLGDMPDIFLIWNAEDPVSTYEMQRNDILENLQGNRNPFIDNPYLATLIWNGPEAADPWDLQSLSTTDYTHTFLVYPTITSSDVFIENTNNNTFDFEVFNVSGQLLNKGKTQNQISFTNLASGLYYLHLQDEFGQKTFKIIKR